MKKIILATAILLATSSSAFALPFLPDFNAGANAGIGGKISLGPIGAEAGANAGINLGLGSILK